MRRLTTIAVCATLLGACGGTSETATSDTTASITTEAPATSDQADPSTTTTMAPITTVATTVAVTPAPTTEVPTTVVETTSVATTVPATSLTALAVETAGEQAALDAAATVAGRTWATGNFGGTEQAAGDPFLVGYEVRLDDGVTQHQVLVIDGAVVSYFGAPSDLFDIPSAIADAWMTVPPETPRQQAAVDAARASLAATAPGAVNGGILAYRVAFPSTATEVLGPLYPTVGVFAIAPDPTALFSFGGAEIR